MKRLIIAVWLICACTNASAGWFSADEPLAKTRLEQEFNKPSSKYSDKEIKCLEIAIYNETRGNKKQGAIEVGATVLNRVDSKLFPNTVCSVVYQPKQFSNIRAISPNQINKETKNVAKQVITMRDAGLLNKTILFFHADYVTPKWSHRLNRVMKVGAHIFYAR